MTSPMFKVLKGNPSDDELAALTAVLTSLYVEATKATTETERNLWGTPESRLTNQTLYNPAAFSSVTFY
ncbi:acyl-CoA carboxylase subunit epsilon [Corynebacterium cystitidis]|uniref:Acyl-CoA carboxylase epsilon subunit n=1 Tax=Corynebacterium cystitidis DSM 20524 TaxID=1121357 RepID=A0A1H9QTB2_9CORY|nr:acyl-CoA carboxylase subunit epsilon [Corynebacterium cystitidis]WJY81690.1 hypothetical protein CCYS_03625 [Corynebacterium cystitidis DSM 20524]SER62943.1 Acyl-CoA carboxylase epsilon subunit [Corynebacterium cystitidis DSM 20524]SNV84854.1 acetyl-CoA carboxylase subunit [Corynebacterium cystitidis]